MRVHWTPEAEQDRDEIWNHIAANNPSAAARMDLLFSEAAAKLAEFPMLGHAGRILGTRELTPHESYRLVYEIVIDENAIWVLALVHTARQWPPVMD
ncbi:type II toxin-antitoxin system RelE/ParE family toxin [Luteimonas sp. R10]|uniref:type II toxin-antitoxin system RelE/ParE family toxin n=1 Tax=Luteimonas sp. R10 TaxID=3108176 RepID=UPI00308ABCF6|nr:type II toxin-antitoxin system RelE/ParE family toxin [Luteimonas sp. R10]